MPSVLTPSAPSNEITRARCWCAGCLKECEPVMIAGDPAADDVEWASNCCGETLCKADPRPKARCTCQPGNAWLHEGHRCPLHGVSR